jgi:hypothetical protein
MVPALGCSRSAMKAQQGRLAAAGRADEGNELAGGDLQIDPGERFDLAVRCLEGERDALGIDGKRRALVGPPCFCAGRY